MKQVFRVVRTCVARTVRGFNWSEYAPIGWIAAAHVLLAVLALFMESVVGMGTIGALAQALHGEGVLHYPGFYIYLPAVTGVMEAFLYTVPGAVLVPLALIRVMAHLEGRTVSGTDTAARLKAAWRPALLAMIANIAILTAWQWAVEKSAGPLLRQMLPGVAGVAAAWFVTVLGAIAIAACLIYVPVVAVRSTASPWAVLRSGVRSGFELFPYTYAILFVFGLLDLPFVFAAQNRSTAIVRSLRPELIAVLLLVHAILISVITYLTYAAAARLQREDEEVEE